MTPGLIRYVIQSRIGTPTSHLEYGSVAYGPGIITNLSDVGLRCLTNELQRKGMYFGEDYVVYAYMVTDQPETLPKATHIVNVYPGSITHRATGTPSVRRDGEDGPVMIEFDAVAIDQEDDSKPKLMHYWVFPGANTLVKWEEL